MSVRLFGWDRNPFVIPLFFSCILYLLSNLLPLTFLLICVIMAWILALKRSMGWKRRAAVVRVWWRRGGRADKKTAYSEYSSPPARATNGGGRCVVGSSGRGCEILPENNNFYTLQKKNILSLFQTTLLKLWSFEFTLSWDVWDYIYNLYKVRNELL